MRNRLLKSGATALVMAISTVCSVSAHAQDFDRYEEGRGRDMHRHMRGEEMHHEMMHRAMRHEMMRHEMRRHEMRRHMMHQRMREEMMED